MIQTSIYDNFFIFCKNFDLETENVKKKSALPFMVSSGTKKKIANIQLIYLGVNENEIWLQGVHLGKSLRSLNLY